MKPRLLDLFCGAGGAAMGYHRAGFALTAGGVFKWISVIAYGVALIILLSFLASWLWGAS